MAGGRTSNSGPTDRARSAPEGGQRRRWTPIPRGRNDAVADRLTAPIAGALTAAWSAVLTWLSVGAAIVFAWVLGAGNGSISDVMNLSGVIWLACHMIPISGPDGTFSALPMGLVIVPGWQLWRAGKWATRRSGACQWSDLRVTVGMGAAVYATVALVVSTATATAEAHVEPILAVLGTGIFALVVFGGGASRDAGLWPSVTARVPGFIRVRFRAAFVAVGTLACAAALLLAFSLAWHFTTGMTLMGVLAPGLIGNVLLFLLGILYLPNMLIWAISFVVGSGFAVGEGTSISPFGVTYDGLPAFPLLSAVPDAGSNVFLLVLLVPLVAGALATLVLSRAKPLRVRDRGAAAERVWVAGIAGTLVLVASWFAAGSLGGEQMAKLGPDALTTGLATFVLVLIGGLLGDSIRMFLRAMTNGRAIDVRTKTTRRRSSKMSG